ncbi:MAG: GerMN domain-containing protein [Oscillospiraceae bacterium]|nr:GerMN domain-containing protein [Oscillospiraceae bacterium]
MKKKYIMLLGVLMLMLLYGCGDNGVSYTVYHKNAGGDRLIPETQKIAEGASVEETVSFLMGCLASAPKTESSVRVLPEGTELLGVSISGKTAVLDLSSEYYDNEGVDELLSRMAIVNTICGIDGVDGVRIRVGGSPLVSKITGEEIGVISGRDVANGPQDTAIAAKETVTIYFPDKEGTHLVPERREIELQASISVERLIISELAKGPTNGDLIQIIPSDINLISIETNDGVCFVNISGDFVDKIQSGSSSTTMALYSIVNSLTELDGINSVQILINGKTGTEFGNFVLDAALERNNALIKE